MTYPDNAAGQPTDGPWFTADSIKFLDSYIKKDTKILEFGSGRSTVWMAKRSDCVVSVEDDPKWMQWVHENAPNASVILTTLKNYSSIPDKYPNEYFDLIIIDGDSPSPSEDTRYQCVEKSIRTLKRGGVLFFDNAERIFHRPTIKRCGVDNSGVLDLVEGWELYFTCERPASLHGNWYSCWWVKP